MKIQKNVQWKEKTFTRSKAFTVTAKLKQTYNNNVEDGTIKRLIEQNLRNTVMQKIGYDVNNDVKYLITKNNRNAQIKYRKKIRVIMRDSTIIIIIAMPLAGELREEKEDPPPAMTTHGSLDPINKKS
jgi:hypothetical protein